MDERTRMLMTKHKVLYLRDDIDRLYMSRKEGGRGPPTLKIVWIRGQKTT